MNEYVKVGNVSDFPPGTLRKVVVSNVPILIANFNGKFYAISNSCTHRGAPLSDGESDHGMLICPWHGGQFNITTGKAIIPPPVKDLSVFDVLVKRSEVFLKQ
jgi:3-phenylpropionate/trans-cinnamate dioxygenase ferredoxin subunit